MERGELEKALSNTREILKEAITTSQYEGKLKANGQEAKNAAIRGSKPIQQLHTVFGLAIESELKKRGLNFRMWPPSRSTQPELKVTGLLKAKNQDLAFTFHEYKPEVIETGVQSGQLDEIGYEATNRSMVIGVRSQMSSIAKNFDTLAERSFAETLNLRLRCPLITLGEVYLIPLREFADEKLKQNKFAFRNEKVDVSKFLRIFNSITDAKYYEDIKSIYKYNATTLIVADFEKDKVNTLWSQEDFELEFGKEIGAMASNLTPDYFVKRICDSYYRAHELAE